MLSFEELREAVEINQDQLDQDCSLQPSLFLEASELCAKAKAEAKVAKHNLERLEAQIALKYRQGELKTTPEVKITETSILSLVQSHPEVIEATKVQDELEREASRAEGLVGAFDHRRSMLSNLITLVSCSYYNQADIKPKQADKDKIQQRIIDHRRGSDAGKG